jgi:lipopolysaccharide/colanic/teichoic acid biosynthesis glycosyltransferase
MISRYARSAAKALIERIVAGVLIVLLSPVLLACALAILWRDGWPVLFIDTCVGRGGKLFGLVKFRSMRLEAGARITAGDDSRITPLGAKLRHWKLDELPQLWNVLRGEMSFVGPRPIIAAELEQYGDSAPAYLACVPGISGLWQVSGRSDTTYAERVALDSYYVRNWSVWLDLYILAKTARVVLLGKGAY